MRTRAITAMTALVTLVAVGACSKKDNGAAMDTTSTTTTTSPGMAADSSMSGMPMTHADSVRADSIRADSVRRADSTAKKP
jgi:hypothetical protein